MHDFSLNNFSLLLEVDVSGVSLKSAAKSNEKLVNEKYAKCSYLGCPLISSIKKKCEKIYRAGEKFTSGPPTRK